MENNDSDALGNVVVVLVEPLKGVNVGNALRAMNNMGVSTLRLVNPTRIDRDEVVITGRKASAIIDSAEVYASLEEALQDADLKLGCTARPRRAKHQVMTPRQAALRVATNAREHKVAVIMGREDRGLTNEELDLCDIAVVIPSSSMYPVLNLAQALVIVLYEIFIAASDERFEVKPPKRIAPRIVGKEFTGLISQIEESLWALEFFTSDKSEHVMRVIREVMSRAQLDRREANILRGIFMEVAKRVRGDSK